MWEAKREENDAKAGRRKGGLADLMAIANGIGANVQDYTKISSN